jgi:hypothetical protein
MGLSATVAYINRSQNETILVCAHARLEDSNLARRMSVCPWFYLVFVLGSEDMAVICIQMSYAVLWSVEGYEYDHHISFKV